MIIVPMERRHAKAVARLHCASVKGLLSDLGPRAATAFYAGCATARSARAFVGVEEEAVVGFVLGSVSPASIRQESMRENPVATLSGLGLGIVRRPATLRWLLRSFRGPDEGNYDARVAELTYIAIAPESRSLGLGGRLVEAFSQAMQEAGASAYELSVDDDNRRAIGFYERLGFRQVGLYREFGTLHRRLRLELSPPATPMTP